MQSRMLEVEYTLRNVEIKTWNANPFHLEENPIPENYDKITCIQN